MNLGEISAYFESGNTSRSVGTISFNHIDPGGKSYGKYQIATRTGTLKKYIAWSIFNKEFQNVNPASAEFDAVWKRLAEEHTKEFEEDQFNFIKLTHYNPVERAAATLGFDVNNRAIQEALFSIGVQHGGFRTILKAAAGDRTSKIHTNKEDIECLYAARTLYIQNLNMTATIKRAIFRRYEKEQRFVLAYLDLLKGQNSESSNTELSLETVVHTAEHLQ